MQMGRDRVAWGLLEGRDKDMVIMGRVRGRTAVDTGVATLEAPS